MLLTEDIIKLIVFLIIIYFFIRVINKLSLKPKKGYLSYKVKSKADWKFKKLLTKFKEQHKREPTKDELFRIIINASHITIRRKGRGGHWGRQKVRKYLLEKKGIVANYKMR